MDRLFFFLLSVTLLSSTFSFTGADVIMVRAVEGEECTLPCSRDTALELSALLWSHSDMLVLVFREAVQEGYEDRLYTNRVQLQDPELQTNLSVVLKNVTEKDGGVYRCEAVYEDGQQISQLICLNVTEPETTKDEAHTEIETEANTEPSLGLIPGLMIGLCALIPVNIALCVLFQKRIKDSQFSSNESSCLQKLKKFVTTCLNDSSSSSASFTLSNGSDEPFTPSWDTEQTTLKPQLYSGSCPPC